MTSDCYDVAVVGAGIVGLAVAREVVARRPGASVIVVDKQACVAQHQTGHNSGVIHAGVYYTPGSLKARLCVEGAKLMYEFCAANGVAYERCGKLIVAVRADELGRLAGLEARGHANGVPGLRRVEAAEITQIEPECRGLAALHSPATGIVDFGAVARAIEQDLRRQGVTFALSCEVSAVRRDRGANGRAVTVIAHPEGTFRADWAIVCAGLWSDRLAVSAGAPADPRVVPFRGAYLRLAAGQPPVVRGMVYPVPDPELPFLGVHVTKHIGGGVMLGPTALLVAARDGYRRWLPRPWNAPSRLREERETRPHDERDTRPHDERETRPHDERETRPHDERETRPHGSRETTSLDGREKVQRASEVLADVRDTLAWPGTWTVARTFWRTGLTELAMAASHRLFVNKCAQYVPAIASMAIEPGTASGVRAQAVSRDGRLVDDFVISQTPGATHVRNAPSPAATSSLALAREIVDQFEAASAS